MQIGMSKYEKSALHNFFCKYKEFECGSELVYLFGVKRKEGGYGS